MYTYELIETPTCVNCLSKLENKEGMETSSFVLCEECAIKQYEKAG